MRAPLSCGGLSVNRRACRAGKPCYPVRMTDERVILAIGRIERALSQLEARLAAPAAPDPETEELRERCATAETRHADLRESTADALARLDRLLRQVGR